MDDSGRRGQDQKLLKKTFRRLEKICNLSHVGYMHLAGHHW